ncbi:transcriptional regulator [Cohaesibacter celericrescens]|uniref:Transcriptional regulator n=1 Tax=Cohaesibacter celericrescens TaxID=2067669 RepID=A0A2N5XV97_9HYPH|nr:transcriptional regulator [Cohaesibacter celericrescens]
MSGNGTSKPSTLTQRRPRRVTASDVAKAAGVSRSAVSRAFTDGAYLDDAKRTLIKSTALQLGYQPNALAASLQGNRTNLVGIIAGDLGNHYDSEFVAQLVSGLNAANKWPLVLGGSEAVTEEAIRSVLHFPLDVLIVRGGSIQASLIDDCAKLNIPVIFSGHVVDAPNTDCVSCRNAMGTALATELLIAKGRRAFGYVGGPPSRTSQTERLTGVTSQLQKHGLELVAHRHADFTFEGGSLCAQELLAAYALDAIICANDAMALGVLSAARIIDKTAVPRDLSVIGFDDIAMACWPDFNLTTIRNPIEQTVSEILRLLEARLEDPDKAKEVSMIDPILIERGTH